MSDLPDDVVEIETGEVALVLAVDIMAVPLENEFGSGVFAGMRTHWTTLEDIEDKESNGFITDMIFIESATVDKVIASLTEIRDQLTDPNDEEKE